MGGAFQSHFSLEKILQAGLILGLIFYFLYHTTEGNRSVFALQEFEKKIEEEAITLSYLTEKREGIEQRVNAMRGPVAEGDYIEQQIRSVLGYMPPHEYVIFLN